MTLEKIYTGARIVTDGQLLNGFDVVTRDGLITALEKHTPRAEAVELDGLYLSPGFIDIHCHGGDGAEFIDASPAAVRTALDVHFAHGTRVLYPTFSATDFETLSRGLETVEQVKKEGTAMIVPGVHLEGPYLSREMSGAQDGDIIHAPEESEYQPLFKRFGSLIARWTYAPEHDENRAFLAFLKENGIVPAVGHSAAQYKHLLPAYEEGCRLVTHLYSCTSSVVREQGFRKLGIIECAYLFDDMFVETIGDGKHLPDELLKMIVKIKGPEHVCLITDAIRYAGGDYAEGTAFDGKIPYVIEDGVCKLADRTAFAGSIATADVLLKTAVRIGCPLPEAVKMLTETPARAMGLSGFGRVAPGYSSSFTVFDGRLNVMNV